MLASASPTAATSVPSRVELADAAGPARSRLSRSSSSRMEVSRATGLPFLATMIADSLAASSRLGDDRGMRAAVAAGLLLIGALWPGPVAAQVYRWVEADGTIRSA
jgi:hypothetical protein